MGTPRLVLPAIGPDERDAVAEFFRQHEPALRRAARRYLGRALRSSRDSQEILQSVCTDLLVRSRAGHTIPDGPELIGLVRVMVKRKVARYWEKAKKMRPQRLASGSELSDRTVPDLAAICPATVAEQQDAARCLLARLPNPTDQQILSLTAERFTAPEIARCLGLTPGTVRARLMRLRQTFRPDSSSPSA